MYQPFSFSDDGDTESYQKVDQDNLHGEESELQASVEPTKERKRVKPAKGIPFEFTDQVVPRADQTLTLREQIDKEYGKDTIGKIESELQLSFSPQQGNSSISRERTLDGTYVNYVAIFNLPLWGNQLGIRSLTQLYIGRYIHAKRGVRFQLSLHPEHLYLKEIGSGALHGTH